MNDKFEYKTADVEKFRLTVCQKLVHCYMDVRFTSFFKSLVCNCAQNYVSFILNLNEKK